MARPDRIELAKAILQLAERSKSDQQLAQMIADYLVKERRTSELEMIMRDVESLRENQGYIEATVTSAFPLSRTLHTELIGLLRKEFPQAQKITIDEIVDPNVIGGLRVEAAGKQLDTTVRNKLQKLKAAVA